MDTVGLDPKARTRRRVVRALAALGAAALSGARATAADGGTVRIVIAYPPGGSNDVAARILMPALQLELGSTLVIENKPGANGTVGADHVARSAPDGRTLLLTSASPLVIVPHVMKTPFDSLRDLAAVNMVAYTPEALGVHPGVAATGLRQLLQLAKTQDVRLASSGNGGMPHLTIELLRAASKGRIVHVPYKGGGPATTDALGGHVDGVVMDLPALLPHFQSGKLRPLALTSAKRDDALPDVPTAAEQGLAGVDAVNWIGVFAPGGTPPAIVARLHAAIAKVVARPEVATQLRSHALMPQVYPTPAVFRDFVVAEHARWGRIARDAGLTNE